MGFLGRFHWKESCSGREWCKVSAEKQVKNYTQGYTNSIYFWVCSAIQVLPHLQKSASHLYSFQRTPSWVGPRVRYKYSSFVKTLFTWVPLVMMLYRWYLYCYYESRVFAFTHHRSYLVRRAAKKFAASIAHRLKAAGRPDLAISLMPDVSKHSLFFPSTQSHFSFRFLPVCHGL
jgi:hypothetical protein